MISRRKYPSGRKKSPIMFNNQTETKSMNPILTKLKKKKSFQVIQKLMIMQQPLVGSVVLTLKTTGTQAGPELDKTAHHLAASLNNQPASHVMNFSQD